jgi:parallel beta-helix repeat protein
MLRRLVVAGWLVLASCTVPNPEYCDATRGCQEGFLCDLSGALSSDGRTNVCVRQTSCASNPDLCTEPTPICADGLCVACVGPGDCAGSGLGICDEGACRGCEMDFECTGPGLGRCHDGDCVECLGDDDCTGGSVCDDATFACRPCAADAECASGVCAVDDGRCIDAALVAYVSPTGSGAACSKDAPCDTLAKGVTRATAIGPEAWIALAAGSYVANTVLDGQVAITGAGAELRPVEPVTAPVINVVAGARVTLQRMKVTGGGAGFGAIGCQGANPANPSPGTLHLLHVTVGPNQGLGVAADLCDLVAEGNRVTDNREGGLYVARSNFTLVNNLVVDNGREGIDIMSTTTGGVHLSSCPYLTPPRAIFAHNTVVENRIRDTTQGAAVRCQDTFGTITLRSSILYDNVGPSQVSPDCVLAYSDVDQLGVGGTGVINMPPLLDADYRLTAGSPCRDRADPLSPVSVDREGTLRPMGLADMGADEL